MKKSATHIWKSAQVNVGLPDGPPGLSEPQYANFQSHVRHTLMFAAYPPVVMLTGH